MRCKLRLSAKQTCFVGWRCVLRVYVRTPVQRCYFDSALQTQGDLTQGVSEAVFTVSLTKECTAF